MRSESKRSERITFGRTQLLIATVVFRPSGTPPTGSLKNTLREYDYFKYAGSALGDLAVKRRERISGGIPSQARMCITLHAPVHCPNVNHLLIKTGPRNG